jgi:hypothetical protein
MTIERYINILAGTVVFSSALLSVLHDQNWILLTMFAGLNLTQSAFTGFCPPAYLMKKMGIQTAEEKARTFVRYGNAH